MATVAVTGASGFVGRHLVPELVGAGHRVIAPVRTAASGEAVRGRLPAGLAALVEPRIADVLKPTTLEGAFAGADAVVHLVAIPRDWSGGADLLRVNLGGTRNVVEAASRAGIGRIVHLGALGVEDRPDLHYAASKARAEQLVRDSGLDWTILRPSLLFGPGDGFFNLVAGLVRLPLPIVPVPGRGGSRFQPLHVDDLARCLRLALEDRATVGRSFDLGGPRTWTYREIVEEVARALGRRRIVVPLPLPLLRLGARTAEALRIRSFPVATDQLRQLALDNTGPIDGVRRSFGFEPRPMEGALGYLRTPKGRQAEVPLAGDEKPGVRGSPR